jgi:hypothetical protein
MDVRGYTQCYYSVAHLKPQGVSSLEQERLAFALSETSVSMLRLLRLEVTICHKAWIK